MLNARYGGIFVFVSFLAISFGDSNLLANILLILSVLKRN